MMYVRRLISLIMICCRMSLTQARQDQLKDCEQAYLSADFVWAVFVSCYTTISISSNGGQRYAEQGCRLHEFVSLLHSSTQHCSVLHTDTVSDMPCSLTTHPHFLTQQDSCSSSLRLLFLDPPALHLLHHLMHFQADELDIEVYRK